MRGFGKDCCWSFHIEYLGYILIFIFSYREISNGKYKINLYSSELHDELHNREFCYNSTNIAPLSKFTEVFSNLWQRFAESDEVKCDYTIFDASLVSHMTSDMLRNYNASEDEMAKHLEVLLQTVQSLNPIVFYLSSKNVCERLIKARQSRGQTSPTDEHIRFLEKREQIDLPVLARLAVESHIMDITNGNWDSVIDEIVSRVTNSALVCHCDTFARREL